MRETAGRMGKSDSSQEEKGGRKRGGGGRGRAGEEDRETLAQDDEIYCGIGPCRPAVLQGCADIRYVTAALCLAATSTSTLSVYINSQLTTLERQFGFSSSVSGVLLSCNDFGYLLTTLFMSYLARRVHILRFLSFSTLLFGLSGLLCTVPFFASLSDLPPVPGGGGGGGVSGSGGVESIVNDSFNSSSSSSYYYAGSSDGSNVISGLDETSRVFNSSSSSSSSSSQNAFSDFLCDAVGGNTSQNDVMMSPTEKELEGGGGGGGCRSEEKQSGRGGGVGAVSEDKKWMAVVFIGVGMVFQGFGKSPRQPFIGTYIDDNVPKTRTTLYLGIVTSCSIFGPVMAFTLGGLFSKTYLTLEDTTMTPMDPRWVGAWWLGFLVFGLLGVVASVPTCFFPRRLVPQPSLRQLERERRSRRVGAKGSKFCQDIKEFFTSLLGVFRSPVYMCMVLGSGCVLFGIGGMVSFMPKYLETQFMLPAWKANMTMGVLNVLSAAGGTFLGGMLTSRLKMSPLTCLKVIVGTSMMASVFISAGFFLGCDQPHISMGASAGAAKNGGGGGGGAMTCSADCHCDDTRFFPVCGADDVNYFSPCHAGCSQSFATPKSQGFSNCSCVNVNDNSTMTSQETMTSQGGEATPGFCAPDCGNLYPFAAMNFLMGFSATIMIMPGFIVNVRSVSEKDKPLAIGFSSFYTSLFGWFLAPIVFGRVVDSCCLLWSSGCQGGGSCSLYDIQTFRYYYHALILCSRMVGMVFYGIALVLVLTGKAKFSPHKDTLDVIADTLPVPAEVEKLMLEKRGLRGNDGDDCDGGDDDDDDDDAMRLSGGGKIYHGNNNVAV